MSPCDILHISDALFVGSNSNNRQKRAHFGLCAIPGVSSRGLFSLFSSNTRKEDVSPASLKESQPKLAESLHAAVIFKEHFHDVNTPGIFNDSAFCFCTPIRGLGLSIDY